jgi:Spy/CpxP family protein refolding chaperone
MFGLAIISVICVNIFVLAVSNSTLATESAQASEVSEEEKSEINLANIQTPEQKEEDEKLKKQWMSHLNQLLTESGK